MMNIKNTKLKKHILMIILIFSILVILPTFISFLTSRVNAADYNFDVGNTTYYEFKTITGRTWRTNESVARLYDYLYDIDPNTDSLPSASDLRNKNLFIGSSLSKGATSESSFHRSGCIFDCGTDKNSAVNILCFEPSKWTFTGDDASTHYIRQVLYITPTSSTFYKQTTGTNYKTYTTTNLSAFNFQNFLSEAYNSQTNLNAATNFAQFFTGDKTWINVLNSAFGDNDAIESGFYSENSGTKLNYTGNTSNYKYSGIFIWYAGDSGMEQGRMAYRVVREKKVPNVEITLRKQDFNGKLLNGATIKIEGYENVASITKSTLTIGTGKTTIVPADGTKAVKIKVTETRTPSGYQGLPSEGVILTICYNTSTGKVNRIDSRNETYIPDSTSSTATIKNKPKINLTINKTDSLTGNMLPGVKFKLELTNVASIDNYQVPTTGQTQNSPKVIYVTTSSSPNSLGQINLTGMVPSDLTENITVTITEMEVASTDGSYYYRQIDPITVTIKNTNGTYSATTSNTSISGVSVNNKNVSVSIKNQPYIDLSGMVWVDGQSGEKNVSAPDGIKNDSEIKEGVLVQLWKINGDGTASMVRHTNTGSDGTYSFEGLEMTNEGYYVTFGYDGINFIETKAYGSKGTDSKATESPEERLNFNNKFKTIVKDKAIGTNEEETTLCYATDFYGENQSVLIVNPDGTNDGTQTDGGPDFRMTATTGVYYRRADDVDCGLVIKRFDLAIGTDVKSARLTINGKETTYNYAQIMNGEMEDLTLDEVLNGRSSEKENIIYSLYLYASDYNYRIEDYKTDGSGIYNKRNEEDETNIVVSEESELKAYVTYSVILKAQTYTEAQVDEFVYYFDSKYTPMVSVGDVVDGYRVDSIVGNKITFVRNDNVQITASDYRAEINIEFEINDLSEGNTFTNITEITKYSTTEGGLIDRDSAPDNGITDGVITKYEDDTDEAKGITISLRDEERTITGTVWDDGEFNSADGIKQEPDEEDGIEGESGVNDVIVQLIEIKTINGQNYEYIWQETRSGSGTVKKLSEDGQSIIEYENAYSTDNAGYYEFTGYIPGNYIIRFIYGDGSTDDLTENIQTYNGQDYKSTVDNHYNDPWFNTAGYTNGQSVARDNEARRLEVMAYSTTIDGDKGQYLENKTEEALENTWMAAETSRINVSVDADNKATSDNSTTVAYENIKNSLSFADMNFGLALRPETKLILEKHITGLKITPNGTGVQSIIDAKADISQVINDTNIDVSGVTEGLATIKSTRDNRGFWQVATDIEELAQGAQLEVEYTYVIRNDSDEDYLSTDLVSNYTNDVDGYSAYLEDKAGEVKGVSKGNTHIYGGFLGEFYYTGTPGNNDTPVLSRVETIEEALNNDLKFDAEEGTSGDDFEVTESEVEKITHNVERQEETTTIATVIQNTSVTDFLTRYTGDTEEGYHEAITDNNGNVTDIANADYSKTVTLRTVLTSSSNGELGGNYQSYIAEIMQYSNAAGRRNMEAEPANLSYVNSEDTSETMKTSNEVDEFWGETIIITKPTGEDRLSALAITIIVISSLAVIAVGIVLIKKFVIKK